MSSSDKRVLFTADAKFSTSPSPTGGPGVLTGYALVWNVKSTDRGGFKVVLAPGSAKFEAPTFALANHDYDSPLARSDNGTLTLTPDTYGVKASIDLANTTAGRDTFENVKSGLVRGMSFGMLLDGALFSTATDADGDEVDTYTQFNCDEVTVTPIPAFLETSVGIAPAGRPDATTHARHRGEAARFANHAAEVARLDRYHLRTYPAALSE